MVKFIQNSNDWDTYIYIHTYIHTEMTMAELSQRKGKPLARMEQLVEEDYRRIHMGGTNREIIDTYELDVLSAFK